MKHNENSRVKIPALVHLTRLGYEYLSLKNYHGIIHPDNLNNYRIPQIPNSISHAFYDIVKPMFERVRTLRLENGELTKLRDWLLPMLMNGQATVE